MRRTARRVRLSDLAARRSERAGEGELLEVSVDDESQSWSDVSGNLPERPHNAELRLAVGKQSSWLYLRTFGRSVWRAPLARLG